MSLGFRVSTGVSRRLRSTRLLLRGRSIRVLRGFYQGSTGALGV